MNIRIDPGLRELFVSGEVSEQWLGSLRSAEGADPWRHGFAVIDNASESVIGSAGYKGAPDDEGAVEIAYAIVPSMQNRGYATEAASALVNYAFSDPRVRLLRAHTLPAKNASTRVLANNQFTYAGEIIDPEDGPVWRWELSRSATEF